MRLIDADDLLEKEEAQSFVVGVRNGKTLLTACKNYLKAVIDNAPTIDAVPVVHARLELKGLVHRCSACGQWYGSNEFYRYCPFCGAKMDGERRNDG